MRSLRTIPVGTGLAWAVLVCLAVFLTMPALRPVHVEGFSASIEALGMHVADRSVADFMPFAPFAADYFGLTKLGLVLWIAMLAPLLDGETAMRVAMAAGGVLVLASSAYLVRRWTNSRWLVIAAVLLLVPGVLESSFFLNDNVPAAGLMLAALALLVRRPTWPTAIVTGVLIGCSVTARTDGLLVAATAVPLIALSAGDRRRAVAVTLVAAVVAVAVVVALFASVGTSPLDAVRAGAEAVRLWDRPPDIANHLTALFYFCGLPALALMPFGLDALVRQRAWWRTALIVGVPLAVNLVLVGKMWEVRQYLVLTPFLGALAAIGAEAALRAWREGRRALPAVLASFCIAGLVAPVPKVHLADGPRLAYARLAGMRLWLNWQQAVRNDVARIDRVIGGASAGAPLAIVTEDWTDDRYVHLQLLRHGFRRVPLPPACDLVGEAMARDGRTIVQLTLREPFVPYWAVLQPQRLEHGALPCLAVVWPRAVVLVAQQDRVGPLLGRDLHEAQLDPALRAAGVSEAVTLALDDQSLAMLDRSYRNIAAASPLPGRLDHAQAALGPHSAFSR